MASTQGFRRCIVLVFVMVLSSSERAHSQPDPSPEPWEEGVTAQQREQAHLHFQLALALHKQLLLEEAATGYQRALTHWKHPKIYFYLSRVWMKLGRPVAAYETLREALRWGPRGLVPRDYEMARQMKRELLATQIAELEIICKEVGAEVTLDGNLLFIGPAQRRVTVPAGKHQVVVKKAAHFTETRDLAIFPGEQQRIAMELRKLEEIEGYKLRWAKWKPWAVVGTGAAALITGGLLHSSSAMNFKEFDEKFRDDCSSEQNGCHDSELSDLSNLLYRARRQQHFAVSAYVVGGVTMACGMVLVALNGPIPLARQANYTGMPKVSVMPRLLASGIEVSASFRF